MKEQKVGVQMDPSILTSSLADFFSDIVDGKLNKERTYLSMMIVNEYKYEYKYFFFNHALEDIVAHDLTRNLEQFPREFGADKSPAESEKERGRGQSEYLGSQDREQMNSQSTALKITPYELPEGYVGE